MSHDSPMSEAIGCDQHRIDQFLQSDAVGMQADDQTLIKHLDSCVKCRGYLESEAAAPETWSRIARDLQPGEFDDASSAIYSAGGTFGPTSRFSASIRDVIQTLAPTDLPNSMGRLGTYEITGIIGVGGMGVVLKASDPSLDRVVAIKVMAPRLANNDSARKRFAREARAAAAVLHPNVIPIHSVASTGTLPYLVMAYIRGGSLQKRLEKEGALPLVEILRIGAQIAAGLAAAHDQGLVHRDIKPENILLEEGVERVTITDFGLARAVDDNTVTQQGTIAGTPMYMSPEQARGEQLDQKSDLFSLGSVLYALCTGQPPYRADSSYGVMRKIIDESPVQLRELNPAIPEWMAQIVEKLMARDKVERFAAASDVHRLLEACLSHVQKPGTSPIPLIANVIRQPHGLTAPGVPRMIKFAAGMLTMVLFVLTVYQFQGGSKAAPQTASDDPVEIHQDTVFDVPDLNRELAERLIGRSEHVTFTKVTTLSPEVAHVLANHPGNLAFPALPQITSEVAKAFADKKKGLWISLRGLKEVTPEVAREFAHAKCALDLGGFDTITPEVAADLAKGTGTLSLGMTSITPEVAEQLARHSGWLSLNSVSSLKPAAATELVKHGHWLSLDGLSTLTPELAAALGQFHGDKLDLNGLASLNLEAARQLSQAHCQSGLYLNGLRTASADVIQALSNGNSSLSFQGLQVIDGELRLALNAADQKLSAVRKHLFLPGGSSAVSRGMGGKNPRQDGR